MSFSDLINLIVKAYNSNKPLCAYAKRRLKDTTTDETYQVNQTVYVKRKLDHQKVYLLVDLLQFSEGKVQYGGSI